MSHRYGFSCDADTFHMLEKVANALGMEKTHVIRYLIEKYASKMEEKSAEKKPCARCGVQTYHELCSRCGSFIREIHRLPAGYYKLTGWLAQRVRDDDADYYALMRDRVMTRDMLIDFLATGDFRYCIFEHESGARFQIMDYHIEELQACSYRFARARWVKHVVPNQIDVTG